MKFITLTAVITGSAMILVIAGCTSMETPATVSIAVSRNAIDNAAAADAAKYAPAELQAARDELAAANKAMVVQDYKLANDLAIQSQSDAKVAQGKATAGKAQAAADTVTTDNRVLQEELSRKNSQ